MLSNKLSEREVLVTRLGARYFMHLIFLRTHAACTRHKRVRQPPPRHANAPRAHVPSTVKIRALSQRNLVRPLSRPAARRVRRPPCRAPTRPPAAHRHASPLPSACCPLPKIVRLRAVLPDRTRPRRLLRPARPTRAAAPRPRRCLPCALARPPPPPRARSRRAAMWGSLQVGRARGSARRQHQIKDGQRRALPGPATLWFETCAPGVRDQLRLRPAYGVLEGRSAKLGRVRQEVVDDDGTREEQCSSRCRGSRCLRPAPGQPAAQVRGGPLRLVPACGANLLGGGGSCALALASESAPCRSIGRSCSRVRRLASALGRHVRRRIGQRHGRGRTLRPSQRERRVHQPSRAHARLKRSASCPGLSRREVVFL